MDTRQLLAKLADVLALPPDQVSPGTHLNGDNWDSVAVLATIAMADESLGVSVSGNRLTRCTSVQQILDLMEEAVAQKQ
jgi:acyl carrier protein